MKIVLSKFSEALTAGRSEMEIINANVQPCRYSGNLKSGPHYWRISRVRNAQRSTSNQNDPRQMSRLKSQLEHSQMRYGYT